MEITPFGRFHSMMHAHLRTTYTYACFHLLTSLKPLVFATGRDRTWLNTSTRQRRGSVVRPASLWTASESGQSKNTPTHSVTPTSMSADVTERQTHLTERMCRTPNFPSAPKCPTVTRRWFTTHSPAKTVWRAREIPTMLTNWHRKCQTKSDMPTLP